MDKKIEEIDREIERKRDKIKLMKELKLLFETGMINSEYFDKQIKTLTSEQNGLVEAYNILVKGEK